MAHDPVSILTKMDTKLKRPYQIQTNGWNSNQKFLLFRTAKF